MTRTSAETTPPPAVAAALEVLEHANSPAELGAHYQTVLNWARANHRWRLPVSTIVAIGILIALFAVFRLLDFELTEFWRGALTGANIVLVIATLLRSRPPPPPASFQERVQTAIDRWRSMVPAMNELPK